MSQVNGTSRLEIGRVEVTTLPTPEGIKLISGTYTYSGKVLLSYRTEADGDDSDFFYLAVQNEDGSGFRVIFSGTIPTLPKANGIRFMPFQDNRRILLGDYVLECEPDIDACASASLVPVRYPSEIVDDPNTSHHWSEIIIAPDNEHISWTILRSDIGAAVALGSLKREEGEYLLENVQFISSTSNFREDPDHAGYLIPNPIRGGEVKQFIRGGHALSVVGGGGNSTPDSVIQDLTSDELIPVTRTPGYDETTIFSPDERLGIVMSTRFSKLTDPAVFGLLPRPLATHTTMGMAWSLYTYAITGVRQFRPGNIGPVLIDIERSMNEEGYVGLSLSTDEDWVYCSPMSWHPNGKSAIWPEIVRGSGGSVMRLQRVHLPDYEPQPSPPIRTTPDEIPYGIRDLTVLRGANPNVSGKIKGKHSGYLSYERKSSGTVGETEAHYHEYSDDGVNLYEGFEKTVSNLFGDNLYEADIRLTGPKPGVMKLRAAFTAVFGPEPQKLLFDADSDGLPKSRGYATYNGVTLRIEDLLE